MELRSLPPCWAVTVRSVVMAATLALSELAVHEPIGPGSQRDQALRHLRLRYLDVKWDLEQPQLADITGDGVEDLTVGGHRRGDFALGLIIGPISPLARMLSIVWPAAVSSECVFRNDASVSLERLAPPPDPLGCRQTPNPDATCIASVEQDRWIMSAAETGTRGLLITGDDCDELHLFWNPKSRSLDSWTEERRRPR
jgi:hypothetical protein